MHNLYSNRNTVGVIFVLLVLLCVSCASVKHLETKKINEADIRSTVTLYLYSEFDYGGVAIIDVEGDDYTFEMFSSPYNYSVMNNLPADHAMDEASKFLASWKKQMRMILDDDGTIIGYEIRPLFRPLDYGRSDIFDTTYKPEGDNIIVTVGLKSEVRKMYEYDLFRSD